ncbi:MAG: hypothetical protein KME06_08080 [Kastovskya adunca ATA6-11-RM4]|jgi:hypothetical protein|nr:hypothetical protein [Kastovskya adunca ATA6-11-RM4]
MSEVYYLLLSRADGRYLAAQVNSDRESSSAYLLMFREHFEALSYLNTHGADLANRFAVETISKNQLKALLQRWGFTGVGIVQDPLIPTIEFLKQS